MRLQEERCNNAETVAYGKHLVYGYNADGEKYLLLQLQSNPTGGTDVRAFSFSENSAAAGTDNGVLYGTPFFTADPNQPDYYNSLQEWYNASDQEGMRDGFFEDECKGFVEVNVALSQVAATTGRTYSIAG